VPENDKWWGSGFTEWRNVVKERPRFKGHHQPQMPADLGYYDLRLPEARRAQSDMARKYGIDGFIYYHYWFEGKRLLESPLQEVLRNKEEAFPIALCWANESWTRAWDGQEREVLMPQTYSEADDESHIEYLCNIFSDDRYIKIDGRPLFLIYRLGNHPCPERFIEMLRSRALEFGLSGVYICGVKSSFSKEVNDKILALDVDSFVDFQPNGDEFPKGGGIQYMVLELMKKYLPNKLYQYLKLKGSANKVVDYTRLVDCQEKKDLDYHKRVFPCAFPSWDNSARRKTATIIQNTNPELFERWLENCAEKVTVYPKEERVVFINAWNEWAEGCHLEPDLKMGHAFLEAVKRVKQRFEK
jgi:lipopolysaccharide biosynthesis protein